jgi:acetyl esterase/lipase
LKRPGEARLKDPNPTLADAVKALFLVYPYINFPARSNTNTWLRTPRTFVVLAEKDHLTPLKHSRRVFEKVRAAGAEVETLELNATHAFDEEDNKGGIMAFSPEAMQASMDAMVRFIGEVV